MSIKTTKIYDRSRIRNVLCAFISDGTNHVRNVPPVQHIARHITEFSKTILFIKRGMAKGAEKHSYTSPQCIQHCTTGLYFLWHHFYEKRSRSKVPSLLTFCVNQAFCVVVGSSICGGDTMQQIAQESLSQLEFR